MDVQHPAVAAVPNTMSNRPSENKALRSCTTCSKAKAKCVRKPGDQICERCARLKKECHLREPVMRRRKVVKATRAAQLEKLESKIEHLVNALATTQSQRGFSIDLGQPSPPVSNHSERPATIRNPRLFEDAQNSRQQELLSAMCDMDDDEASGSGDSESRDGTQNAAESPSAAPFHPPADYQNVGVLMSEADSLLDRYRRLMSAGMPFVVLPPNVTAQQMYAEKPTLLHAIVVVASFHDLQAQQANVKRLLRNLSERILINCEKSIDILQAILVFSCWYHPHVFWSHQGTNLLHLALAMIADMGFNRPPQQCGSDFKKSTARVIQGRQEERVPTLEEHRILAGVFYLTSTISSGFRKIDAMPWTTYLSTALLAIEAAVEHSSDLELVQLVRLQHLIEQTNISTNGTTNGSLYTKAFLADLQSLRTEDPCRSPSIRLQLQYRVTEVLIWELALNDLQAENRTSALRARLDDICHLIDAIKAFLDLFFSVPVSQYLTSNFAIFSQFAHVFVVLIKIASLEIEGWDVEVLRSRIDFVDTIERAAVNFEQTLDWSPEGVECKNDHFGKWAVRIRWMKQVYEAKFAQNVEDPKQEAMRLLFRPTAGEEQQQQAPYTPATSDTSGQQMLPPPPQQQQQQQQQQQGPAPPDDVLSGDFFNYLDEGFWQSFAGEFDLGYPEVSLT